MKHVRYFQIGITVSLGLALVFFQNCTKFQSAEHLSTSQSSSTGGGGGTISPAPLVSFKGVANTDYLTCFSANPPSGAAALAACLNSKPNSASLYTTAAISTCAAATNGGSPAMALCLSDLGQVIQNYRAPIQDDFTQCAVAGPQSQIETCLGEKGVLYGLTQTQIDSCITGGGVTMLESCLRAQSLLPAAHAVFQDDADVCATLEGGTATLAECLIGSQLMPSTVTQPEVNACVTSAGESGVVACLRANYNVPNVVMQPMIDRCALDFGDANIAACLNKQGLLPTFGGVAASVTTFQTAVGSCITSGGASALAKCLRTNGQLEKTVMQQHIDSCATTPLSAANVLTCLGANFAALPAALTATALTTCFAQNNNTTANAAKCLASTYILDAAPGQDQLNACSNFAGVDADTTGTKAGQIGVAACLANSGALPSQLTQSEIDTCVTSSGFSGVALCLDTGAIVPSFAAMNATGGVFQVNCASCHNAVTLAGNMNIADHASVLNNLMQGQSNKSTLFSDVNNGTMPQGGTKLTAADIALIKLWIDQGAANN